MADLNNPAEALTRGSALLGLLGTFWSSIYQSADQAAAYTTALNQSFLQSYRDLMELIACSSRFTVPIYHKSNWSLLSLNQSEKLPGLLLQYGDNAVFGNNYSTTGIIYDYGIPNSLTSDYSTPNKLIDVSVIVNRISEPSVVLTEGIDFIVDTSLNRIQFRDDPFLNELIPKHPVYDQTGKLVDMQLALWLFMGDYDWSLIYEQFGYALNINMQSSEDYRKLVNVVFDAIMVGSTFANLDNLLAIITDTSLVIEPIETVVDIVKDASRQLILTDKHVYSFSLIANPLVTIGQTVKAGARLVSAYTVYNQYLDIESVTVLPAISVSNELLLGDYAGELVFNNQSYPLQVTINANNRTKVTFPLGGTDNDILTFWNQVHADGTAVDSISLAQLLDLRYPPAHTPDPTANNLPLTINPLQFLSRNILRNNAVVVVLDTNSFGPAAMGINVAQPFRQILPPQNMLIILIKVSLTDTVVLNDSGSAAHTGYSETVISDGWIATDPLTESSPHGFVSTETFTFS